MNECCSSLASDIFFINEPAILVEDVDVRI